MCETLCLGMVPRFKGFFDSVSRGLMPVGKLSQQVPVQSFVSGRSFETSSDIYAGEPGENDFVFSTCSPRRQIWRLPWVRACPACQGGKERFRIDRFPDVVIHSRFQATLDLIRHHVGRHGNDWELLQM